MASSPPPKKSRRSRGLTEKDEPAPAPEKTTRTFTAWSEEEKDFLTKWNDEAVSRGEKVNWVQCSIELQKSYGTDRTAKSCQSYCNKYMSSRTVACQTDTHFIDTPGKVSVGCQTEGGLKVDCMIQTKVQILPSDRFVYHTNHSDVCFDEDATAVTPVVDQTCHRSILKDILAGGDARPPPAPVHMLVDHCYLPAADMKKALPSKQYVRPVPPCLPGSAAAPAPISVEVENASVLVPLLTEPSSALSSAVDVSSTSLAQPTPNIVTTQPHTLSDSSSTLASAVGASSTSAQKNLPTRPAENSNELFEVLDKRVFSTPERDAFSKLSENCGEVGCLTPNQVVAVRSITKSPPPPERMWSPSLANVPNWGGHSRGDKPRILRRGRGRCRGGGRGGGRQSQHKPSSALSSAVDASSTSLAQPTPNIVTTQPHTLSDSSSTLASAVGASSTSAQKNLPTRPAENSNELFEVNSVLDNNFAHAYSKATDGKVTSTKKRVLRRILKHEATTKAVFANSNRYKHLVPLSLEDTVRLSSAAQTRNPSYVAEQVMKVLDVREHVINDLCKEFGDVPESMKQRVHGDVSVLMNKGFKELNEHDMGDIVTEFKAKFPPLVQMLHAIMLPPSRRHCLDHQAELIPKLALIYSVMMQTRNMELSLFQRVMSACLEDTLCARKVFDRFNSIGVCLSYNRSEEVFKHASDYVVNMICDALDRNMSLSLVGDNLNFMSNVRHEDEEHHSHQENLFANAAFLNKKYWEKLEKKPEIPQENLTKDDLQLSADQYDLIQQDFSKILADVIAKYLPQLAFVKKHFPAHFGGDEVKTHDEGCIGLHS